MSKSSPLLDDLFTLGGSLFGNLAEAQDAFKAQAKNHIDNVARSLDLVSREEFDAAFAMVAKARAVQDDLQERIAQIEEHLNLSRPAKNKSAGKRPLPSVKQGKKMRRKK